ncbi:MAG: penicillin-insensitive murein endopeptidase [Bacteroidota bacterium]
MRKSYSFEKYATRKNQRRLEEAYPEWEVFFNRINIGEATKTKLRQEHQTTLERFAVEVMGNIEWYDRKVEREKTLRAVFIVFSLGILLILPMLVSRLNSIGGEVAAVLTGFFALYQGITKWLESRAQIGAFWNASSNLKARLFSLENRYHTHLRKEWSQDIFTDFAKDLAEAILYAGEVQREERRIFFENYKIPQFNILSSILQTRGLVNKLLQVSPQERSAVSNQMPQIPQGKSMVELSLDADRLSAPDPLINPAPHEVGLVEEPSVGIEASVGQNAVNAPKDVQKIQKRLVQLGYSWAYTDPGGLPADAMVDAIFLFQAIVYGQTRKYGSKLEAIDGRIDPGKHTEKWLWAKNAPAWRSLKERGIGYRYLIANPAWGDDRWATNWLLQFIANAGMEYVQIRKDQTQYFAVHELSASRGGESGHKSHQTGLDVDIRLPKKDGGFGLGHWNNPAYDREATKAIILAFLRTGQCSKVWFNDTVLLQDDDLQQADKDQVFTSLANHDNHIHIRVKLPQRVAQTK